MPEEIASVTFAVQEELAWEWVMRAIVSHEMSDMPDPIATDLPPIGMMWTPRDVGEEDATFLLSEALKRPALSPRLPTWKSPLNS